MHFIQAEHMFVNIWNVMLSFKVTWLLLCQNGSALTVDALGCWAMFFFQMSLMCFYMLECLFPGNTSLQKYVWVNSRDITNSKGKYTLCLWPSSILAASLWQLYNFFFFGWCFNVVYPLSLCYFWCFYFVVVFLLTLMFFKSISLEA